MKRARNKLWQVRVTVFDFLRDRRFRSRMAVVGSVRAGRSVNGARTTSVVDSISASPVSSPGKSPVTGQTLSAQAPSRCDRVRRLRRGLRAQALQHAGDRGGDLGGRLLRVL